MFPTAIASAIGHWHDGIFVDMSCVHSAIVDMSRGHGAIVKLSRGCGDIVNVSRVTLSSWAWPAVTAPLSTLLAFAAPWRTCSRHHGQQDSRSQHYCWHAPCSPRHLKHLPKLRRHPHRRNYCKFLSQPGSVSSSVVILAISHTIVRTASSFLAT